MKRFPTRRQVLQAAVGSAAAPLFLRRPLLGDDAPSNRLRVGLIGTGAMCWSNAHNIHNFGSCDITALCDPIRGNMARYREAFNVPKHRCTGDYRELLAMSEVDAVIVATPDHWHVPIAIAAAQAGKHIYCQKPLSNTVAEGRTLVETIERTGVVFQHGTQLRSSTPNRLACELVRNGYLGRVNEVIIGSPAGHAIGQVPAQPVPEGVDWPMWLGSAEPTEYRDVIVGAIPNVGLRGWYFMKRFSRAGWIAGYGVHDVDLALWGLGLEHTGPVRIDGRGTFPQEGLFDTVLDFELTFTFADGRRIIMTDTSRNDHGVRFMHENGRDWVFCRSRIDASDRDLLRVKFKDSDERLYVSRVHEANFADCVRRGDPRTIAPVDVAHRATSICLLGAICLELNRPLQWDPDNERFIDDDEANALLG